MLGACSAVTTKSPPEPLAVGDANAGAATKAESAVKMYKDFQGRETEIPVNPQRIAVIAGSGAIIDVKELGLKPLGYPHRYMSNSTILKSVQEELSAKAPDIGMPTNLEQLVALSPDLMIFGYETQDNEYDTLKKIGPVAAFTVIGVLPSCCFIHLVFAWISAFNICDLLAATTIFQLTLIALSIMP